MTKRLAWALVIGAAGCGFAIWGGLKWRAQSWFPADAVANASRVQRQLDALPTAPVSDAPGLAQALAEAGPIPGQRGAVEPPTELRRSFLHFVSEWLHIRSLEDPAAYAEWATAQGWSLTLSRPDAHYFSSMRRANLDDLYRYLSGGEELPEQFDPRWFFEFCFDRHFRLNGEVMRTTSATIGPEGSQLVFLRLDVRTEDARYPSPFPLEPYQGSERWSYFAASGDTPHWTPAVQLKDVLGRDGEALVAVLTLGLKSIRGEFVPTTIAAYYDPAVDAWAFYQVSYSSTTNINLDFQR